MFGYPSRVIIIIIFFGVKIKRGVADALDLIRFLSEFQFMASVFYNSFLLLDQDTNQFFM